MPVIGRAGKRPYRRAAEQRDELAPLHVDFALALITSAVSARQPASLIFTRATSDIKRGGLGRGCDNERFGHGVLLYGVLAGPDDEQIGRPPSYGAPRYT